jgi:hypothetical protein
VRSGKAIFLLTLGAQAGLLALSLKIDALTSAFIGAAAGMIMLILAKRPLYQRL